MIQYGAAPAADELEVTLFGPGYGEAIALHVGGGSWFLVDSCINPDTKVPASAEYLDQIGVDPSKVLLIVASHWHDDHVGGISMLAKKYKEADFAFSSVLNNDEAMAFVSAYSGLASCGLARGSKELYEAMAARETLYPVHHKQILLELTLEGRTIMVTALSPLPEAYKRFLANIAGHLVSEDAPIKHVPELKPNLEAVAIHVDFGDDAILLGADLEEHGTLGWSAVVAEKWSGKRRPASIFKVAHHGSASADCPNVWKALLTPEPMAGVTPFSKGRHRIPNDADKKRLKSCTPNVFVSSETSQSPDMDSRLLKRVRDICPNIKKVDPGFGVVRMRKKLSEPSWKVELFGSAKAL